MKDFISANRTRIITAIPLVLVNIVALSGQYAYLRTHLPWPWFGAAIFAGALESVALFLAYMAHQSLMSQDSSMRLRFGAIGFGLLAGFMNASHYESDGHLTFVSIATGIMSASSPILWGIYSRRQSRDSLMALGLIEPGAVRLGINRWLMYPLRSFHVYRAAAWEGIRTPSEAIAAYGEPIPETEPEPEPEPEIEIEVTSPSGIESGISNAQAITVAIAALSDSVTANEIVSWLADRHITVTAAYVRQIRSRNARRDIGARRDTIRAIGNEAS